MLLLRFLETRLFAGLDFPIDFDSQLSPEIRKFDAVGMKRDSRGLIRFLSHIFQDKQPEEAVSLPRHSGRKEELVRLIGWPLMYSPYFKSFLFLVVRSGAPGSVLAPSSKSAIFCKRVAPVTLLDWQVQQYRWAYLASPNSMSERAHLSVVTRPTN